jgi:hypothetical protein
VLQSEGSEATLGSSDSVGTSGAAGLTRETSEGTVLTQETSVMTL